MKKSEIIVIAHNIRSLHNVGAIFRTSDSFGVSKIYLSGYTGSPPDPKIAKVALGAEEFVPWEKTKSLMRLVKKLKATGVRVVALENNIAFETIQLPKYKAKFPIAVVLGEETKGFKKKELELMDDIIEIPMFGQKESLNVSVACGVVLYGLRAK